MPFVNQLFAFKKTDSEKMPNIVPLKLILILSQGGSTDNLHFAEPTKMWWLH